MTKPGWKELMKDERVKILQTAIDVTSKDRQESYGDIQDNLRTTADLISIYLSAKTQTRVTLTSADIAMMLTMLKISRIACPAGAVERDNFVDAAGYIAAVGELISDDGKKFIQPRLDFGKTKEGEEDV